MATPEEFAKHANQLVTKQECDKIRGLADFDLVMLISEIHDHGWTVAKRTLAMMPEGSDPKAGPSF